MEVSFVADEEVRAAIAGIGRTEDAQFSPDGGRLALAGFGRNRLLVLELTTELDEASPRVMLTGCLEVRSAALKSPHGLSWVDERVLIVANREGEVAIFELPAGGPGATRATLKPVRRIGADQADLVTTPGSVSVSPAGLGLLELIVCNNLRHNVTRHLLDQRDLYAPVASEVLVEDGLVLPDGVAQSRSGRWIAISNHDRHCVFIFRNAGRLDRASKPQGVLQGVRYPHGLRFTSDERHLIVAESGMPFVRLFSSDDGDWGGERQPSSSIRTASDEGFGRSRRTAHEGGPKGIDVTPDGRLLVTTCEAHPLVFFDVRDLVGQGTITPAPPSDADEAERAREALLRYLASVQCESPAPAETTLRLLERELRNLLDSRSFRVTAPLRRIAATLRRKRIAR